METNVVSQMGEDFANALGDSLYQGVTSAENALTGSGAIADVQTSLGTILLLFVGIAALYYVGRWLYKAFKRGAS